MTSTGTAAAIASSSPSRRRLGAASTSAAPATPRKSPATGDASEDATARAVAATTRPVEGVRSPRGNAATSAPSANAPPIAKVIRPANRFVAANTAKVTDASRGRRALLVSRANSSTAMTVAIAPAAANPTIDTIGGTSTL